MNPLNHFGIKTRMIRGDTRSYNKGGYKCIECGKVYKYPDIAENCAKIDRGEYEKSVSPTGINI